MPPGKAFPDQLQAALSAKGWDVDVVNAGVSGDTAEDGLARYDWSVPADANALIVELGANDMLRGLMPEATKRALAAIVDKAEAAHLATLIAGMRAAPNLGPEYDRAFDAVYPAVAKASGAMLYPFFLEGVAGDARLNQPDGLHPTAAGVAVIVEPDPAVGRGSASPGEKLSAGWWLTRSFTQFAPTHSSRSRETRTIKLASVAHPPQASGFEAPLREAPLERAAMSSVRHILTLSCANRPGIVAKVSAALFDGGFNILDAQQFDDTETGNFFMRVEFNAARADADLGALREAFTAIAANLRMTWSMRPSDQRKRVVLMVSRFDHCLVDLLYRWRRGELPMEPVAIIANHPRETYAHIDFGDIPFHYLPVASADQDGAGSSGLGDHQIVQGRSRRAGALYADPLRRFRRQAQGRCVNIHHSFLPGFRGARPYHQAHARGVKLIGATAHFVTSDLDEGPIIEQDVERISHRDTPEVLVRKGRDIERRVLSRALANVLEDRVLLNQGKTVVFAG